MLFVKINIFNGGKEKKKMLVCDIVLFLGGCDRGFVFFVLISFFFLGINIEIKCKFCNRGNYVFKK